MINILPAGSHELSQTTHVATNVPSEHQVDINTDGESSIKSHHGKSK